MSCTFVSFGSDLFSLLRNHFSVLGFCFLPLLASRRVPSPPPILSPPHLRCLLLHRPPFPSSFWALPPASSRSSHPPVLRFPLRCCVFLFALHYIPFPPALLSTAFFATSFTGRRADLRNFSRIACILLDTTRTLPYSTRRRRLPPLREEREHRGLTRIAHVASHAPVLPPPSNLGPRG